MTSLETCRFCGGRLSSHWPEAAIYRCSRCDLRFRNPAPTPDELRGIYEQAWTDPSANRGATGGTDLRLARIYTSRLIASLRRQDLDGLKILDFGGGSGAMSLALAEHGAMVYGLDPFSHNNLAAAGVTAYPSLDAIPPEVRFDGVVALDVIEHLLEPWREIERLARLLTQGGWIYLSTINTRGLHAVVRRSAWREARKLEHVVFFTRHSLEAVLASCGFTHVRHLFWSIPYHQHLLRRLPHYALQRTRLESGLRYLAFKP